MNVSLEGARSQARLDWNVFEERRKASTALRNRLFLVVLTAFAAYMAWQYVAG
jgi:hypothetical protein